MDMPPSWFVHALSKFASEIVKNTCMTKPLKRIVLDVDFGMRIGLPPGEEMLVHTAAGYVEVATDEPMHCPVCLTSSHCYQICRACTATYASSTMPLDPAP